MGYPAKETRNKLIVELKDKKKLSFTEIGEITGLKAKSTVHEIYHREKSRSGLSTD